MSPSSPSSPSPTPRARRRDHTRTAGGAAESQERPYAPVRIEVRRNTPQIAAQQPNAAYQAFAHGLPGKTARLSRMDDPYPFNDFGATPAAAADALTRRLAARGIPVDRVSGVPTTETAGA